MMKLVSIIVPTYNLSKLTLKCLAALFANTAYRPVNLIWVDNDSEESQRRPVKEFLAKYCPWPYQEVLLDENQGWTGGCIAGYELAQGDTVVLLNNDTEPDELWLAALMQALERDSALGVVGCVTDNLTQWQGLPKLRLRWPELADAADGEWLREHLWCQVRAVHAVAFFAVALRRTMLEEIGFLDPRYEVGFADDDDLCWRARRAGWGVGIALSSFVPHLHRSTFRYRQETEGFDWKAVQRRNAALYHERRGVKMDGFDLAPRTVLRFMGKDGFPFVPGIPARDLTWGDMVALELERGITKEDILKAKKSRGQALYVDVGPDEAKLFGPGPLCGAPLGDGRRCKRTVKEWGQRCYQHPEEEEELLPEDEVIEEEQAKPWPEEEVPEEDTFDYEAEEDSE